MHRGKTCHSSWSARRLLHLDLDGGTRNDHQVAAGDLVLTAHQLADRSDALTMAALAGFVMKPCSGFRTPEPEAHSQAQADMAFPARAR
jgi:hypothetical protein